MEKEIIEQLPSDELIVMTKQLHRLFNAGGCNPMCHCCKDMLLIGIEFKLGTIKETAVKFAGSGASGWMAGLIVEKGKVTSHEVMLCKKCTPADYKYLEDKMFIENKIEYEKREKDHRERGGGCFRINGKIVH